MRNLNVHHDSALEKPRCISKKYICYFIMLVVYYEMLNYYVWVSRYLLYIMLKCFLRVTLCEDIASHLII